MPMKPGCCKRFHRSTIHLPGLAGLWLVVVLGGVVLAWAWPARPVQAARQPQSSRSPRVTGSPGAPTLRASASAPASPAPTGSPTVPVTATLPSAPTVLPTATLLPLPLVTYVQDESTPTAALLASGQHPAGTGFPKDPAPAGLAFLRRWSVPLVLLALWLGLVTWVVVLLALAARSSNR